MDDITFDPAVTERLFTGTNVIRLQLSDRTTDQRCRGAIGFKFLGEERIGKTEGLCVVGNQCYAITARGIWLVTDDGDIRQVTKWTGKRPTIAGFFGDQMLLIHEDGKGTFEPIRTRTTSITTAGEQLSKLEADIGRLRSRKENLEARRDNLERNYTRAISSLQDLHVRTTQLKKKIGDLEDEAKELAERAHRLFDVMRQDDIDDPEPQEDESKDVWTRENVELTHRRIDLLLKKLEVKPPPD
jgi:prefoldin subunit 5